MYVVAVGLGGNAGMDGASTDNDRAPIVVGVPLYGPCETERVTSGFTGAVGPGDGGEAGMGKYEACGAGCALTTAISAQRAGEKFVESMLKGSLDGKKKSMVS